jgi:hypothetical protein
MPRSSTPSPLPIPAFLSTSPSQNCLNSARPLRRDSEESSHHWRHRRYKEEESSHRRHPASSPTTPSSSPPSPAIATPPSGEPPPRRFLPALPLSPRSAPRRGRRPRAIGSSLDQTAQGHRILFRSDGQNSRIPLRILSHLTGRPRSQFYFFFSFPRELTRYWAGPKSGRWPILNSSPLYFFLENYVLFV